MIPLCNTNYIDAFNISKNTPKISKLSSKVSWVIGKKSWLIRKFLDLKPDLFMFNRFISILFPILFSRLIPKLCSRLVHFFKSAKVKQDSNFFKINFSSFY